MVSNRHSIQFKFKLTNKHSSKLFEILIKSPIYFPTFCVIFLSFRTESRWTRFIKWLNSF